MPFDKFWYTTDLWGEAILSANHILNKIPLKKKDIWCGKHMINVLNMVCRAMKPNYTSIVLIIIRLKDYKKLDFYLIRHNPKLRRKKI